MGKERRGGLKPRAERLAARNDGADRSLACLGPLAAHLARETGPLFGRQPTLDP